MRENISNKKAMLSAQVRAALGRKHWGSVMMWRSVEVTKKGSFLSSGHDCRGPTRALSDLLSSGPASPALGQALALIYAANQCPSWHW